MKTYKTLTLVAGLVGWLLAASAQDAARPEKPGDPSAKPAPAEVAQPPPAANAAGNAGASSDKGLRLNFRGVPLDMVLNYLSDAAGFIIVLDTEVKGKVDVWSNQPLSKEEAVQLLNTVLSKNGYAAIRNGRTLKIVSREEAKTKDVPVRSGNDPEEIPKSDEMVTQVITVKHASAAQLVQNLQPLLPSYARDSFTANESGNALVLTASQSDVRRMVEIIKALDDSISSTSSLRVFPLRYADAKELANAVKELFQPQTQQNQGNRGGLLNNPFFGGGGGFGGGGFGGGAFGGAGGQGGQGGRRTGGGSGAAATIRVVAVPDEHSNALIVSAPEDAMPMIEKLVNELDVAVADITELRVFHLNNADPLEMADILSELFPDDSKTGNNSNSSDFRFNQGGNRGGGGGGVQGFRPFGGLFGNQNNNQSASSQRNKKMGRVLSVPDQRTSSLIVSAAGELMPQIEQMIAQLDASPAKKQKVFVYSLEHADVQQAEQIVRDMFDRSNAGGNRNTSQNSPLLNRAQQLNQNQMQGGQGGGGFGGGQGGGGLNGGQFNR